MTTRSLFVPTPDVQQYPNYYLVQLLAKERVRCILTGDKFGDISPGLVEHYLTVPPRLTKANEVQKFYQSEGKAVMDAFERFEKTPMYQDALKALLPMAGNKFEIASVTVPGIMVLIEVPDLVAQ